MDPEKIAAWIALATPIFGLGVWIWRMGVREKHWRDQVNKRVTLLWRFRMRRGYAEAISSGLATPRRSDNRDLFVADHVRAALQPKAAELRRLYDMLKPISKDNLMEEIEREFGDWLTDNICVPFGVHDGACLQFAAQVAMETESDWPA